MKYFLLPLIGLLAFQSVKAQFTQTEFAFGSNKSEFMVFTVKSLDHKNHFSYSAFAFFQKFHLKQDVMFDEVAVSPSLFWNINKNFALGPSVVYNNIAGFQTKMSVLTKFIGKKFIFFALPSVVYSDQTKKINGELFIQLQFMQPIKNEWNFLAYTQILSGWLEFSNHARSFQQLRIGLSKNNYQFGLSTDLDEYGSLPVIKTTYGVFLRKVFIDK